LDWSWELAEFSGKFIFRFETCAVQWGLCPVFSKVIINRGREGYGVLEGGSPHSVGMIEFRILLWNILVYGKVCPFYQGRAVRIANFEIINTIKRL